MRFSECFDHLEWVCELGREADAVRRSDNRLFPETGAPRNFTGVQKVIAHQMFGRLAVLRVFVAELSRDLFLEFEGQGVGVAAGIKMKKVPNAMMEFKGLGG